MKTLIKKSLLVLMVVFIAVFTLGVSSKVKAAEEVYKTLTFTSTTMQSKISSYTQTWKTVCDGDTWNISNANNNNKGWAYIRMGRKSYASTGSIATAFAIDRNVTKVVMKVDSVTTSNIKSIKLDVATDSSFSNISETVTVSAKTGNLEFNIANPIPNAYYKITVDCSSASKNGIIQISKVEYYADPASSSTPSVSIKGVSYTDVASDVTLNAELSNLTGEVTWASSNTEVATIDQTGVVTPLTMGTTTITATVDDVIATHVLSVYPTKGSELTVAEAIEVCKFADTSDTPYSYSTTGVIKSIDDAYSSQYNNITVTITDGTASIKVFRLKAGSNLEVGDKIKVTGALVNYLGNTPEFVAGTTYELDPTTVIQKSVNKVNAYMSFAYKYTREDVEKTDETTGDVTIENKFTDVDFRIKCGVDKALADIEGVESYGIKVFTADKEMNLAATGNDETCLFAVISLGDALTNAERLNVVFTVQAYIVVDGVTYTSKLTKSFSIAQMVEAYYNNAETSDKVVTLYELIQNL